MLQINRAQVSIERVRWLVAVVVIYAAVLMLPSARAAALTET